MLLFPLHLLYAKKDDLELQNLKHLQLTQEEMMRVLSIIDEPGNVSSGASSNSVSPRAAKKPAGHEGFNRTSSSKRARWKNWGWKHSPGKSSSIEEEPLGQLESPKKSISLYSPASKSQSPKRRLKVMSDEAVNNNGNSSKHQRSERINRDNPKAEFRASADARLIQMFEDDNGEERIEISIEKLKDLDLSDNNRPASIHVTQNLGHLDNFWIYFIFVCSYNWRDLLKEK